MHIGKNNDVPKSSTETKITFNMNTFELLFNWAFLIILH